MKNDTEEGFVQNETEDTTGISSSSSNMTATRYQNAGVIVIVTRGRGGDEDEDGTSRHDDNGEWCNRRRNMVVGLVGICCGAGGDDNVRTIIVCVCVFHK